MYYLKKFATDEDYLTYINGEDVLLPNVSYCASEVHVHYNPFVETRLVAIFDVQDANPTLLYQFAEPGALRYKKIEIDGVEVSIQDIDENNGYYNLSQGQHTVKYTLIDPTTIGDAAFGSCSGLTSITIPNSVTTIGQEAFESCSGLTSIEIPNSVISIGSGAFASCSNLTSVTIGNSLTSIGSGAFANCSNLTSVTVDSGNAVYDSRGNCNAIIETSTNKLVVGCKNTIIPNSVTSIGNNAFYFCTGLTSVTIPNSVTSIGNVAFGSCSGLTSITIPNSVTSIDSQAFVGCSGLESIKSLATTAPTIQSSTFRDIKTGGTLTVPSGSSGYDVWMGTGNYYLGLYGWTKVEQ